MAVRSVGWRRICPERVAHTVEDALKITLYLVHQRGPTGFVLKEEREKSKIKVFLGDPHTCSCSYFKKNKELCVHLLWVLLKKFRIPRTNPVIWQLGLVEREINEIVYEHLRCQSPSLPDTPAAAASLQPNTSQKTRIPPKEIGSDDVCPICQDDLLKGGKKLTYCRFSCGKSMHVKCMRIWSDHQKSMGEHVIQCPLCRQDFGSIITLTLGSNGNGTVPPPLRGREKPHQHLGTACSHCHVCPIVGRCYKCMTCPTYFLCQNCHASNQVHVLHSFVVRQHCSQPWHPVTRTFGTNHQSTTHSHPPAPRLIFGEVGDALPPSIVQALQTRSLTEEDYELLLSLDRSQMGVTEAPPTWSHPERRREKTVWLPTEILDTSHRLLVGGACCGMCQFHYRRGDWVTTLPCTHQFHQDCVTDWLAASQIHCPYDNLPIHPRPQKHNTHQHSIPDSTNGLYKDERHQVVHRRVRGGVNMPLTKATTIGRDETSDKLKFGISGTKLEIRKNPFTDSLTSSTAHIPAGAVDEVPSKQALQAHLSTKEVTKSVKVPSNHFNLRGRNTGIGVTGLNHERKNDPRTRKLVHSPAQVPSKMIQISVSKPASS